MIDYDSFFALVDIEEGEKGDARHYIDVRGLREHIDMAKFLHSKDPSRKPTYKEVATAFRYDKRVRRILYIYIGLLEEYIRAYLCNNFPTKKSLGIEGNDSLYDYLYDRTFTNLIRTIKEKLDDSHLKELFEGKEVDKDNLDAIIKLRDAIGHNRTLLDYKKFKPVRINGEEGESFSLNIKNLKYHLPNESGEKMMRKLLEADYEGGISHGYQVKWSLPSSIKLDL